MCDDSGQLVRWHCDVSKVAREEELRHMRCESSKRALRADCRSLRCCIWRCAVSSVVLPVARSVCEVYDESVRSSIPCVRIGPMCDVIVPLGSPPSAPLSHRSVSPQRRVRPRVSVGRQQYHALHTCASPLVATLKRACGSRLTLTTYPNSEDTCLFRCNKPARPARALASSQSTARIPVKIFDGNTKVTLK